MEEERLISSRENPRNLGFPSERGASSSSCNRAVQSEVVQKPPPPILERFRAFLKEREDELKVSEDDEDVPVLSSEDVVRIYEAVLAELAFNSKPIITELTIIAGEQREHAEGIADAICARIVEVPVEQKLPSLYLLDSIVKNIGCEYVKCFASRLPDVFCEAYRQVHPSQYPAMRHLFGTWSAVFPPSVLRKIGAELQFPTLVNHSTSGSATLRASESQSRPTHGIHVNPKYLEARRLEQTVVNDIPDPRGISSSQQQFGQKHAFGYADYDIDHSEVISQKVGLQRRGSPGIASHTSFLGGAERELSSKTQLLRSSSPSRTRHAESLSSLGDGFTADNSPGRAVERTSPSHSGFEFGPGRLHRSDGESNNWWLKHSADNNHQHREASSAYNHSNGYDQQRPRALIDAYGSYKVKNTDTDKPLKIEQLDVKSITSETAMRRWQNSEEEEYVWEDMSPTLADRSRSNDLMPSNPPLRNFNAKITLGRPNASVLETDYGRGSWSQQAPQRPIVDDSAINTEDGISVIGPSHGSISKKSVGILGTRSEATLSKASDHSHEPWNLKHTFPKSLQQLNPKVSGKAVQTPFLPAGTTPLAGQKIPSLVDNLEVPLTMATATPIDKYFGQRPRSALPPLVWPPINARGSQPPLPLPILPPQKQIRGQFDLLDANKLLMNQGLSKSLVLPQQQLDIVESKPPITTNNLLQLPNQLEGLAYSQSHGQVSLLPPQLIKSQEARENSVPSMPLLVSSHLVAEPSTFRTLQGRSTIKSTLPLNQIPGLPSSITVHGMPNTSFQLQGRMLPPLPPGPPPASSQMGPTSHDIGPAVSQPPVGNAFSGLINSLVAQGLISLTTPVSIQDSVGVEFNPDLLKVRHESAITALYADLPRQCTTCGLRFKCQEDHSSHMDWHVTKNRISKSRKQKPSRKWFVGTSVWLSGAEALGTEAVPGFLPTETVVEKKDDEEMAVPADENQSTCALCGEPFDDFYSDETEEWMYKGAVYMNVPDGSVVGMDRSQLGPIVHAKCRSESTVVPPDNFVLDEGGKTDEGNQRKRMRV